MGILEFASPWMAPWLAAAAIPIAIHILHRRKQQTIPWAAVKLLLEIVQRQSRRMQFEQWLLLILRTAILLLFAFTVMRPWRPVPQTDGATGTVERAAELHVIVLDASYSMSAREGKTSRWDGAVQAAERIVRERRLGDAVSIIRMAQRTEAVNNEPSFEYDRIMLEIERLQCSAGNGDLVGSLDLVERTVRSARQTPALPQSIHVHYLTDLENETWHPWLEKGVAERWKALASSVDELRVETFASSVAENTAVTELRCDQRIAIPGRPVRVTAVVSNYTSQAIRVPLQFQENGNTIRSETVTAPPSAATAVNVELTPPDAPYWTLTAEIPGDRLTIDDRRHLVIPVRRQLRVACVEEDRQAAVPASLALAPGSTDGGRRNAFQTETMALFELNSSRLSSFDAVVLCNIRRLSAKQVETLDAFIQRGGAVMAMLDQNADAVDWNRDELSPARLFGFRLKGVSDDSDYAIDPLQYRSPIAAPFEAYPESGLLTTPIFRYWKIDIDESARLKTDLALSSGDPWIVHRQSELGRTAAMLSSPARGTDDEPWNAIGTWPSFVPLMQQLVQASVGNSEESINLEVGDVLRGKHSGTKSALVRLITPRGDETSFQSTPISDAGGQSWSFAQSDQAGVYQAAADEGAIIPYAVNIDPEQSRLAAVPGLAVSKLQSKPQHTNAISAKRPVGTPERTGTIRRLLILLLCGLVCESLLAWSMGRRFA